MKEIFANLIVFQLVTSEWFQKKMKVTHLDNKGKRIFTSIIFIGFFLLYLSVHIFSKYKLFKFLLERQANYYETLEFKSTLVSDDEIE
jgi:uncharacterized membrane protein YozB (DUF420 family)